MNLLDTPIEDMNLSRGLYCELKRAGIDTVGGLPAWETQASPPALAELLFAVGSLKNRLTLKRELSNITSRR